MMKICENLKEGNSNHHERFHSKRGNISARYNDWKFVAISGSDVPMRSKLDEMLIMIKILTDKYVQISQINDKKYRNRSIQENPPRCSIAMQRLIFESLLFIKTSLRGLVEH